MKKSKKRRYRSDAFAAIHETAKAMYRVGGISKTTMREFDESCLETVESIKPAQYAPCGSGRKFRNRSLRVT